MHLTLAPDSLAERLGLWSGQVPEALLFASYGPTYGRAIVAGARLGLYDALGADSVGAAELAQRLACDPVGVEVLCRALVGFGVLERAEGRFRCGPAARRFLCADSPDSLRDAVLFMGWVQRQLQDLEEAVRTGALPRLHEQEHPPEFWAAYLGGLASFARIAAREVVRRVRVRPARVLDAGGGHGVYAAAFCARHGAQATVLDLPAACAAAQERFAHPGVRWEAGDLRQGPWGEGYDLVLLFNVLHNATEAEGPLLLRRAAEALRPGGTLLICDAAHRDRLDAGEGFGELFFFLVSGARAWPEAVMRGWATAAGLQHRRTRALLTAPAVLLELRRPDVP